MKVYKKWRTGFLILLTVLVSMFCTVSADGGCTLRIEYMDEKTPVAGAAFSAWRVADVLAHGQYKALPGYEGCEGFLHTDMTNDAWEKAAAAFSDAAASKTAAPDAEGTTGADGVLVFPGLPEGVYLVQGSVLETGGKVYRPQAFCAVLPDRDTDGTQVQELTVTPKFETEPVPSDGTVTVRKTLTLDGQAIVAPHEIFYVALFSDRECTQAAAGPLPIEFTDSSVASVEFSGLKPETTYYIKETDASGKPVTQGDVMGVEFTAVYPYGNAVKASVKKTVLSFENRFPELPSGFYFETGMESETETEYEAVPAEKEEESVRETERPQTEEGTPQTEKESPQAEKETPQTGDDTATELWLMILLASGVMFIISALQKNKV